MTSTKQQHWQSIIDEQAQSDLTKADFCQQRNIKLATFYYWLKKLRTNDETQCVLPVLLDEKVEASCIEVFLPSGLRICLPCNLSCAQIRHWLEALQ
ncbi:transposase [Vibrio crassostreae]|nr:transposase [Vibrio crassostreae]